MTNIDLMFSSKTDLWETPQNLFDELDKEFNFDIDVCATPENAKCDKYFTKEKDGLKQAWQGTIWCNPPYGRNIGQWIRRAYLSSKMGYADVVMLLPASFVILFLLFSKRTDHINRSLLRNFIL